MPRPEQDVRKRHTNPGRDCTPEADGLIDYGLDNFLVAYKKLNFGWEAAVTFAANHIPFPACLEGDDEVVHRAYLHNCDRRYFCQSVWEAQSLCRKGMAQKRATLESMLLVAEITIEEVAKQLSLPVATVIAYEKLFFNILDRRKDSAFIAEVVYPDGRFIETFDDYMKTEDVANVLKRIGYNTTAFEVLYWAGFRSGILHSMSGPSTPGQLEALIMANGLLLARSGFLSQQMNASGLHIAKTLLAAAKQGGEETKSTSPMAAMGAIFINELKRVKGAEADEHIDKRIGIRNEKAAKAKVIDVPPHT